MLRRFFTHQQHACSPLHPSTTRTIFAYDNRVASSYLCRLLEHWCVSSKGLGRGERQGDHEERKQVLHRHGDVSGVSGRGRSATSRKASTFRDVPPQQKVLRSIFIRQSMKFGVVCSSSRSHILTEKSKRERDDDNKDCTVAALLLTNSLFV
jgi:hypothetical protein